MQSTNEVKVGIIGFGRFGKLLATLLADDFQVLAYDPNLAENNSSLTTTKEVLITKSLTELIHCETVFIAVPIREFEKTIKSIASSLLPKTTVIDVCSVKIYPVKVMLEYLPQNTGIIATHPLFGPDSINNPNSRKIMMNQVRNATDSYLFWKNFFQKKNITIVEMTPEQHDELAARSQSITHFIGRVLSDAQFETTGIDTKGFQKLLKLKEQTCNDSWDLFFDLQHYNPYSKKYIYKLMTSAKNIYDKIQKFNNEFNNGIDVN